MKPLVKRMLEHTTNITNMSKDSALVQHMVSHPGHTFDMDAAKIIWRTRSKYESQLVEAACINRFPSCNISKGEIRVTPAMSAFTTYIAGLHRQSGRNTFPDSRGSITPLRAPPPPHMVSHSVLRLLPLLSLSALVICRHFLLQILAPHPWMLETHLGSTFLFLQFHHLQFPTLFQYLQIILLVLRS